MTKQELDDQMYMNMAYLAAERSRDPKHKVGSVVVTPNNMMTLGWNGTPDGDDNETREPVLKCTHGVLHLSMDTKRTVMHAEYNAITKFAGSTASAADATLYTTLSPCLPCAMLAWRAKFRRVVWHAAYIDTEGLDFLEARGVELVKV